MPLEGAAKWTKFLNGGVKTLEKVSFPLPERNGQVLAWFILSEVKGPALSEAEGPALSQVEGPALSQVEGFLRTSKENERDLCKCFKFS